MPESAIHFNTQSGWKKGLDIDARVTVLTFLTILTLLTPLTLLTSPRLLTILAPLPGLRSRGTFAAPSWNVVQRS